MTRAKTDCFAYKPGQQKPPRRKAESTALDKLYRKEGECRFYKDRQDMVGYPKDEYIDTQKMSTDGALIRAQGEQIRETPRVNRKHSAWIEDAEKYIAGKYRIRGDADGDNKGTAPGVPE